MTPETTPEDDYDAQSRVPDGAGLFIVTSRLNIDIYLNERNGEFPPAMFSSFTLLEAWCASEGYIAESVGKVPPDEARLVRASYDNFTYESIWVHTKSERYRRAMNAHFTKGFGERDENGKLTKVGKLKLLSALRRLHADHVINRARLASLPESWVMLMPVGGDSNSSYGSIVERKQPAYPAGTLSAKIDPLILVKIFAMAKVPRNLAQLEKLVSLVSGQMVESNFKADVLAQMRVNYLQMNSAAGNSILTQ
ncbi:hypothetical protein [Caballeronia sordidicola]|uniref:hypothetical protein n=1 Tax=Caballeronia sordidicola TaxID=196367 RepID=UPI0004D02DCA|nr:hypothetical protein [Caballeronia sordidicola]